MAKLIQVIDTEILRGIGTGGTVRRQVKQYWTPDGELLAECDPCGPFYDRGEWVLPAWAKTRIGSPIMERQKRRDLVQESEDGPSDSSN